MLRKARLVKVLFFGTLFVGLYIVLVLVTLLPNDRCSFKTRERDESSVNAIEGDETFQLGNIQINALNQHTWQGHCQTSFEQLCNYPIFPKAPDSRDLAQSVNIASSLDGVDGLRLLGFLRPNATGKCHFLLASNGFAEVWLSADKNWRNAKQIAYTKPSVKTPKKPALDSQISNDVHLVASQTYFIEVIYARGIQRNRAPFIKVTWKRPDQKYFETIDRTFFLPYTNDSGKAKMKVYDDDLPDVLACVQLRQKSANKYMGPEVLPYLKSTEVHKALDFCEYRPTYLLNPANLRGFRRYHGVRAHTRKTYSFPYPNVRGVMRNGRVREWFKAENPLDEQEARQVVIRYMEALEAKYPGKYKLQSIKRVEKKQDQRKGGRYFLELVVKDLSNGANCILAEYVFQPNGKNSTLCYPRGLQWNRTADVYLILTAKNLGRWVHHFIKNVERIVQETNDEHLHAVVYDFDSPDIDLKQAFERSTLKNYHFIRRPGKYSRTVSFTEAIQSIKDPNAIVVTIDLHLDIGSRQIDDIRKHCSKGKTVYAPQIVFLHCGGSSAIPKGVWFHASYGTIAMYKQDWQNFGGFSKAFMKKATWGGEDWDIIDNAVKSGLEIERKRSPWVYHYHHTKAGMWKRAN